jgi:ABC-type microcin C transport system permease subunit YejE
VFNYNDCEYIKNRFKIYRVKQKKRKILSIIFIVFLIIFSFVTYLTKIVNPLVFNYASAQIEKLIAKSSNQAIESITLTFQYNDIVDIKYDSENKVLTLNNYNGERIYITRNSTTTTVDSITIHLKGKNIVTNN